MLFLGDSCDWAVVIYGEEGELSKESPDYSVSGENLCKQLMSFTKENPESSGGEVVHCQRAPDSQLHLRRQFHIYNKSSPAYEDTTERDAMALRSNNHTLRAWLNERQQKVFSIPKTALYKELLPLLPNYRRVFLLDEDIFLHNFGECIYLLFIIESISHYLLLRPGFTIAGVGLRLLAPAAAPHRTTPRCGVHPILLLPQRELLATAAKAAAKSEFFFKPHHHRLLSGSDRAAGAALRQHVLPVVRDPRAGPHSQ